MEPAEWEKKTIKHVAKINRKCSGLKKTKKLVVSQFECTGIEADTFLSDIPLGVTEVVTMVPSCPVPPFPPVEP